MASKSLTVLLLVLAALLPSASNAQSTKFDQLNGLWTVELDGVPQAEGALTESYPELGGVRLRFLGDAITDRVVILEKTQVGDEFELDLSANDTSGILNTLPFGSPSIPASQLTIELESENQKTRTPVDDEIHGNFMGKTLVLKRDTRAKPPIEITLPGDRPWVRFMQEILIPKTAEDRETYHRFDVSEAESFLYNCQLYASGYWQRRYMYGDNRTEQEASYARVLEWMRDDSVSPRTMMYGDFRRALEENLSADARQNRFGLAASGLGMYFSTAAGGSVRLIVTDNRDSIIYYITDARRNSKIGLVVMDTPAHKPLASSFGRWLLDLGLMPKDDDPHFGRALIETLAQSSSRLANNLSDVGKSAYSDYLGVMAIEDQRGVMFDNAGLKWGLNMTNASFCALIARALSHGETRDGPAVAGREWLGLDGRRELDTQVIVRGSGGGWELRPGEPSYFDTLNGADNVLVGGYRGGDDLQERGGMTELKQLTTEWLREDHFDKVLRVEDAFAVILPVDDLSEPGRARSDIFHLMSDYFYEPAMAALTQTQATEIVRAASALLEAVSTGSKDLEAFLLDRGVVKNGDWAPRASGF